MCERWKMVFVCCIQVDQSTDIPVTINSPFIISISDGLVVTCLSDQEFVRGYFCCWRELLAVVQLYELPHFEILYSRCVRYSRNNRRGLHLPDVVPDH